MSGKTFSFYTIQGFMATLLWSTTFTLLRGLTEHFGMWTAGSINFFAAGSLGLLLLLLSGQPVKKIRNLSPAYIFCCGPWFILYMTLLIGMTGLARSRIQVVEASMINFLWPTLTILLSLLLLNWKARWLLLFPGSVLAICGIFIVISSRGTEISIASFSGNLLSNPLVYCFAAAAALSWAMFSTLSRRIGNGSSLAALPFFMLATSLAMLIIRQFLPAEPTQWDTGTALRLAGYCFITLFGNIFWCNAIQRGNMSIIVAFSYFTPLFSSLIFSMAFETSLGLKIWLGCLMIISGSILSRYSIIERTPTNAAKP